MYSFTKLSHGDLVLRNIFLVNGPVYGINLLKFYVRSTITHILGNLKRMRTITHARPFFRPSVRKNGLASAELTTVATLH